MIRSPSAAPAVHPPRTKENYALFLESPFWKELSARKRAAVGKCETCGSKSNLQAHHHRYPSNWWESSESDLTVLCRPCHEKTHGIFQEKPKEECPSVILSTIKDAERLRAKRMISRGWFKEIKRLIASGVSGPFPLNNPKSNKIKGPKRRKKKPGRTAHMKPFYASGRQTGMRWVQRGTSSN